MKHGLNRILKLRMVHTGSLTQQQDWSWAIASPAVPGQSHMLSLHHAPACASASIDVAEKQQSSPERLTLQTAGAFSRTYLL